MKAEKACPEAPAGTRQSREMRFSPVHLGHVDENEREVPMSRMSLGFAMTTKRWPVVLGLAICAVLWGAVGPVHASSKYQTTLVPNLAGTNPGFSASGSSIKIQHGMVTGKIKGVVDGAGNRVTTDPTNPADNYSVRVDFTELNMGTTGAVTVTFDLKNGNGSFAKDASTAFSAAGATPGDGIAIDDVRVIDNMANVIGGGGVVAE